MPENSVKPAVLVREVGINRTYAWQLLENKRAPSRPLAIRIFRTTGLKLGELANLSDRDITALEKLEDRLAGAA